MTAILEKMKRDFFKKNIESNILFAYNYFELWMFKEKIPGGVYGVYIFFTSRLCTSNNSKFPTIILRLIYWICSNNQDYVYGESLILI